MKEFPNNLTVDGVEYELATSYETFGNGRSIGPFYSRAGVDGNDWQFMPDITFTAGIADVPTIMHCIQMRAQVSSPRP